MNEYKLHTYYVPAHLLQVAPVLCQFWHDPHKTDVPCFTMSKPRVTTVTCTVAFTWWGSDSSWKSEDYWTQSPSQFYSTGMRHWEQKLLFPTWCFSLHSCGWASWYPFMVRMSNFLALLICFSHSAVTGQSHSVGFQDTFPASRCPCPPGQTCCSPWRHCLWRIPLNHRLVTPS